MKGAAAALVCLALTGVPARAQTAATPTTSHPAAAAIMNDPKRAEKDVDAGDKAAAEGRFDDALAAYDEAAHYAPQNLDILGKGAALRMQLVRAHTDNAEQFALNGDVVKAIEEFHTAMRIDPGNPALAEREAQVAAMPDNNSAPARTTIQGLPKLNVQQGKHNLDLHGDTRSAYDMVTHMFGIKAAFDPDLPSRRVHLRVEDVDFATAISLLSQSSGTFWRPVGEDMIFVAADTSEKRKQFAVQATETFPLSAAVAPEEMTELLRVLREITASTRVELDTNSRSITIRDTPEKLALAGELIDQVQRARGEVMLEIELLEVDKNKALQLGITPPPSAQAFLISPNDIKALSQASDLTNALTILGQLFSAQGITSIPGFTLVGGGYSTFLLTLPTTAANFSRCVDAGAKRPSSPAARARRKAGDIFRWRSLSDYAFTVVGQPGHGKRDIHDKWIGPGDRSAAVRHAISPDDVQRGQQSRRVGGCGVFGWNFARPSRSQSERQYDQHPAQSGQREFRRAGEFTV